MKKKIGLTGSTGSLGKIILRKNKRSLFNIYKEDIRNRKKVFQWIENNNFDIVIHLAAIVPIKEVNKDLKKAKLVNFIGTKNLVDACRKKKIKWFFFASTSHVYKSSSKKILENFTKKPISYYGRTKLMAERYIIKKFKFTGVKYCIGRIFSTTNKNQKKNYLIPDLKYKIKNTTKKIVLSNLNHYRDFISMEDISKILFILLKKRFNGVLNLGSGCAVFLEDVARLIAIRYKKKIEIKKNKKITYLVANTTKLKRVCNRSFYQKLDKLIF